MRWFLLAIVLTCPVFAATPAADPFSEYVRSTDPKTPDAEQKTFHVPDGFQVQLIAAEPEINKPMNLAFDARGRLWVTETHLYPIPAKDAASRKDCIKVIELGEDGRAGKVTTFADNLDIPVGIYPIGDGSKVIAYDINNVCLYSDTDGDGKSDQRKVLYSGWGYERDTHGMASNFRRGFDGWLYGCHGFNNISDVKGADGQVMHLQSGNTYRMRLDGSHIEPFTIGQINPFGMSMDPLGNIYTSDSHSKPIYELLRGGRYEAFDRNTDDGLGLAPRMMEHLHGSTAIAGSCYYAARQFPQEFRDNVFVGNVVTCRINRDKLEHTGSSPRAIEQPDLLSTDDPWFRPVNTVLGPDGALYIADFYNRIIAHYEVKLDNPGRDYLRGRIWRLSYKKPAVERFDISKSDVNELIAKLNDANLLVRQLATDQLSDRIGKDAIEPLKKLLSQETATTTQKVHAMWALYRLGAADESIVQRAAGDADATVRVHAMRVIAESSLGRDLGLKGLADTNALVRRCAADALGQHPDVANIRPLLDSLAHADAADTHFVYTLRMAVRNQLRPPESYGKLKDVKLSDAEVLMLADMSVAIDTPEAATFLLDHIQQLAKDKAALTKYLQHAVRFATAPNVAPLAALMREKFSDDIDLQLEMFQSVRTGLEQRGQALPDEARQWGEALASDVLRGGSSEITWTNTPLDPNATIADPWDYEIRRCGDQKRVPLLSSLPGGEQATSVLRSKPFSVPPKLVFFLAGHNGPLGTPELSNNIVRLKLETTNEVIAEKKPPRDDVARKVTWDLSKHAGEEAYLEITDADAGTGWAWLAFGRFNPPVVEMPKAPVHALQRRLRAAADYAALLKVTALAPDLERTMLDHRNETDTRAAMAAALATLHSDSSVSAMKQIVADSQERMLLRERVAAALGVMATPTAQQAIVESFRLAPRELQTALANALASNTASAETLLAAVADGKAPPQLLMDLGIHDRLAAAQVPDLDKRVKKLTQGVAAPKEQLEKLIAERRAAFKALPPPPDAGQAVFAKNCIVCHTIDGKGGVVGPQLAGLSKRGIDRLVEDVLDPNRNLDPAFRYSTLILKDGRLITGLQKRVEGETLVFADTTGKEVTVRKGEIQKRIESPMSLMPANFAEIIKPEEFNALMAYLLSK